MTGGLLVDPQEGRIYESTEAIGWAKELEKAYEGPERAAPETLCPSPRSLGGSSGKLQSIHNSSDDVGTMRLITVARSGPRIRICVPNGSALHGLFRR